MKYSFLSGGTGTPKLLQGFRQIEDDSSLGVICNTGDDHLWYNLHVSPDLDTILYLFSEKLDLDKFWGVKNESFNAVQTLKSLKEDIWFNIGDLDLGLHVFRTNLLETKTLTEITKIVCQHWGIKADILPMSNQLIQTKILTPSGILNFQDYFVKHQTNVEVKAVDYGDSDKYATTPEVNKQLSESQTIIIGPSNPVTSIGPILSVDDFYQSLRKFKKKTLAISPIIGSNAFSGPTVKLMKSQNVRTDVVGIANYYQGIISKLIVSEEDIHLKPEIEDLGIEPIFLNILLKTNEDKKRLARELINLI